MSEFFKGMSEILGRPQRDPILWILKAWPETYQPIVSGQRMFDVRKGGDRTYCIGDLVDLVEIEKENGKPTGAHAVRRITYVLHGEPWLPPDLWILSLKDDA